MYKIILSLCLKLKIFVASLKLKMCISHLCCVIFAHINTCIIFFIRITETQIRMQQDRHNKEKRDLKRENQQLKNDNHVQKVSVAYIQPNLQCCQDLLFVAWPITGSCELTLTAVLIRIL
jgi:hypothetical protein